MRPAKRRLLSQTPLLVLFRAASVASFWQRPRVIPALSSAAQHQQRGEVYFGATAGVPIGPAKFMVFVQLFADRHYGQGPALPGISWLPELVQGDKTV